MAQRDRSQHLRVKEILRRPVSQGEIVCYAVVSGRGKQLMHHLIDSGSEQFAKRLVRSINGMDDIAYLLGEFDSSSHDGPNAKRAAEAKLVRDIRHIVRKSHGA